MTPIHRDKCKQLAEEEKRVPKPDVMARLREIWGERVFTEKEVEEMRAAELEGEEG